MPADTVRPAAAADLRAQRYGAPRRGRRLLGLTAIGLVVTAALTWLMWVALDQSTPDVTSQLRSFEVMSDNEARATVIVVRRSPDVVATCLLRAFALDKSTVGELVFQLGPDDPETSRLDAVVRTERRATQVVSVGCTTPDQRRPR